MNVKNRLIHLVARNTCSALRKDYERSAACQARVFRKLITNGRRSQFGRDHQFSAIQNISDFQSRVPIRDYEDFQSYIQRLQSGQPDILWPGKPKYLAKTSGTTSGMKYIPLTRDSIKNHLHAARNSLFHYIDAKPDTKIFEGSMFFLSGSPELHQENGIAVGRLSGIVNHEIPNWFKRNKLPNFQLNTIQPWEDKIEALVEAYSKSDIRVLSGIPPWIQMFCERILDFTGKSCLMDVFPNLELYIHGGVNFSPYQHKISQLIGGELTLLETYPASEGFIAFQDQYQEDAMQLVVNDGIFYEFVEKDQASDPNATRLRVDQVELHKDYAIILSTNAGLWAYRIGDLVRFVSLNPHKIKVSGRISQFISAFGEHVISSEIDHAMSMAQKQHRFDVVEFTVAPQVSPTDNRTAYHEWFIEFSELPKNLGEIARSINQHLCECNAYYRDLIDGKILDTLKIRPIRKNGFLDYMRKAGKLGEQYKVQRLSNDRQLADHLSGEVEEG